MLVPKEGSHRYRPVMHAANERPEASADRNIDVMQPYLAAAARTGRSQVAAIGVAQETQRVFIARKRDTDPSRCPQFSFGKKDSRVTVYYVGRGVRAGVHQGLHLLPAAGQGLG
jgi:hypothetical protein